MVADLLSMESTAATLDEAVDQALTRFGCSRAEIDVDILDLPSRGFLGMFGKKPARVHVRLTDRAHIAATVAAHLLESCGFSADVEVVPGRDRIELNIVSDDSSLIIGRHGQTLDALQSIVVSLVDRHIPDRTPIVLESDGYRKRRTASLEQLARRISGKVRRSGESATLHPLPPEERRILHQALRDERGIETRSVGGGYERKMIISRRAD